MLTYSFLRALFSARYHNHNGLYFRQNELSSSGFSAIHWDNITDVPAIIQTTEIDGGNAPPDQSNTIDGGGA